MGKGQGHRQSGPGTSAPRSILAHLPVTCAILYMGTTVLSSPTQQVVTPVASGVQAPVGMRVLPTPSCSYNLYLEPWVQAPGNQRFPSQRYRLNHRLHRYGSTVSSLKTKLHPLGAPLTLRNL